MAASLALLLLGVVAGTHAAQQHYLGPTTSLLLPREPYRGWSSWSLQAFKGDGYGFRWLNETNVMKQADVLAQQFSSAGYNRINLDSGWQGAIDEYGRHLLTKDRFPSGMVALRKYLARRNLKLGLYYLPGIDARAVDARLPVKGTSYTADEIIQCPLRTTKKSKCRTGPANAFQSGYSLNYDHPGAQAYIDSVVELLYEWDVSFVKLDANVPGSSIHQISTQPFHSHFPRWDMCDTRQDLKAWRSSIDRIYNQQSWSSKGRDKIWLLTGWELPTSVREDLRQTSDSWRVSIDIEAYGSRMTTFDRVVRNTKRGALWTSVEENRGSGLIDLDSMIVSDMMFEEAKTKVTLWSIVGSPIYLGDDLTKLDPKRQALLLNPSVLEIQRRSGTNPSRLVSFNSSVLDTSSNHASVVCSTQFLDNQRTFQEKRIWVRQSYHLKPLIENDQVTCSKQNDNDDDDEIRFLEWEQQIWWSQFENGDILITLVNAGRLSWFDLEARIEFKLLSLPLKHKLQLKTSYRIFDVWKQQVIGFMTPDATMNVLVPRHGSVMWLLQPNSN